LELTLASFGFCRKRDRVNESGNGAKVKSDFAPAFIRVLARDDEMPLVRVRTFENRMTTGIQFGHLIIEMNALRHLRMYMAYGERALCPTGATAH
jgi:hypothetical protein